MRFIRVVGIMLRYDVLSSQFILSVALVSLSLFILRDAHTASALQGVLYPIQWNNVLYLASLAICFSSASLFIRDVSLKYHYPIMARIGQKTYLSARFSSSFVASGLALVAGIVVATFLGTLVYHGFVSQSQIASGADFGTFEDFIRQGHPLLFLTAFLSAQFLYGSFIGGMGVLCTAFVPNRYIGYIMPFILVFAWSQISRMVGIPLWLNPLSFARCLEPMGDASTALGLYLAVFGVFDIVIFSLFFMRAKRMLNHG